MLMSETEKIEIVWRLKTAHDKTKEFFEHEPAMNELHLGTEIARNWPAITAAYSGLEQTLKYLIAEQKEQTVAEIVHSKNSQFKTHDLGFLFSNLEESKQEIVQEFYDRFRSLHSYIDVRRVDEFLGAVSGAEGDGYQLLRYALIEDGELPRNSPEALLAIWNVCVEEAKERTWEKYELQMPERQLTEKFCQDPILGLGLRLLDGPQKAGEPFQNIKNEVGEWLWRSGHPLNSFAEVLWHYARYGVHGVEDVSEGLSDTLTRWSEQVVKCRAVLARTSIRAFVTRAQGLTPIGASIRWNPNERRFYSSAWNLESFSSEARPENAVEICDFGPRIAPFSSLWKAAKDSGYRVLENQSLKGLNDEDRWFKIIEVRNEESRKIKPILSIWKERNNYFEPFYLVEECAPEEVCKPIRRWINIARRI